MTFVNNKQNCKFYFADMLGIKGRRYKRGEEGRMKNGKKENDQRSSAKISKYKHEMINIITDVC